jgi:hypothetical protein
MHWRQVDLADRLSHALGVTFTDSAVGWWEKGKRAIPGAVVSILCRMTGAPEPWKGRETWNDWRNYQQWQWVKAQIAADKKKGRKSVAD